jgi:hypothetical protein
MNQCPTVIRFVKQLFTCSPPQKHKFSTTTGHFRRPSHSPLVSSLQMLAFCEEVSQVIKNFLRSFSFLFPRWWFQYSLLHSRTRTINRIISIDCRHYSIERTFKLNTVIKVSETQSLIILYNMKTIGQFMYFLTVTNT